MIRMGAPGLAAAHAPPLLAGLRGRCLGRSGGPGVERSGPAHLVHLRCCSQTHLPVLCTFDDAATQVEIVQTL